MLECGLLLSFCTEADPCLSKLSVPLKLRKVCVYLGVIFLAQTQGYHLVCIWGSLVNFQVVGVVVKFDVSALLCSLFVLFASKQ